ncbi:hypothetical protein EHQ53_15210 [Leptospira langatensis]|uniref:Uncharacterized protein n=1 Tax=Leptospira langatensis TaxID=2484983 RepID=A0A5F1ZSD8_9LEPT|nr:DUF6547 family protein [Leptospira langatensis]TGK01819.1 hypothetical protein EHO57_08450 [Leptospira langatensis]TGL39425.1 hypothetical protein EHQ53_15210 [Leptospira langatensis]
MTLKSQKYRNIIDSLVGICKTGQGKIGSNRIRSGIWNSNAKSDSDDLSDEYHMNQLLARLSEGDRSVLARMLENEVIVGIFETLKVLEEYEIDPFDTGYEGSPYHDFIGRLSGDWEWPEK